jgi:hypothetical protein
MPSTHFRKITRMIALCVVVLNHRSMGRKLTDEEFADPDFQALLVSLEKASKPIARKIAELKRAVVPQPADGRSSSNGTPIKL